MEGWAKVGRRTDTCDGGDFGFSEQQLAALPPEQQGGRRAAHRLLGEQVSVSARCLQANLWSTSMAVLAVQEYQADSVRRRV